MDHIVVGIDAGMASDSALDWAIHRVGSDDIEVRLVTSTERSSEVETARLESLRARVRAACPRARVEISLRGESIVDALALEALDALLLVVGYDPRHPVRSVFTGSMPLRIASAVDAPTVIVPKDWSPTDGDVIACLSDDGTADDAAFVAAREADRLGARLTVLHAWEYPTPDDVTGHYDLTRAEVRELHAADVRVVTDSVAQQYPGLEIAWVLDEAPAAQSIVEHARDARLLVMGTHGLGVVLGALLGSVGADVVHGVRCPVCIVPHEAARVMALLGIEEVG